MVSSQKEEHKYCRNECFTDTLVRLTDTYSFQLMPVLCPESPWHICIIKMQLKTFWRRNRIELMRGEGGLEIFPTVPPEEPRELWDSLCAIQQDIQLVCYQKENQVFFLVFLRISCYVHQEPDSRLAAVFFHWLQQQNWNVFWGGRGKKGETVLWTRMRWGSTSAPTSHSFPGIRTLAVWLGLTLLLGDVNGKL